MGVSRLDEVIAKSRILQLLDAEGRERLARIAQEVSYTAGEIVIHEGDPGDAFYAILSGSVTVAADDFGSEKHLAQLEPGAVFGEIGALTREPRTATVTARTAMTALRFEMVAVFAVLKDYPDVLAELNRLGVTRSEDTLEKMM